MGVAQPPRPPVVHEFPSEVEDVVVICVITLLYTLFIVEEKVVSETITTTDKRQIINP